jgi:hypothetical protein
MGKTWRFIASDRVITTMVVLGFLAVLAAITWIK